MDKVDAEAVLKRAKTPTRELMARSALKDFKNDLRDMSPDKMKRELDDATRQIEELEPWQEALTFALEYPAILKEELER